MESGAAEAALAGGDGYGVRELVEDRAHEGEDEDVGGRQRAEVALTPDAQHCGSRDHGARNYGCQRRVLGMNWLQANQKA